MPAFTFTAHNAYFSVNYDGLTTYPITREARKVMVLTMSACHKLFFRECEIVEDVIPESLNLSAKIIRSESDYGFERYILREDDDHNLFHKDKFNMDDNHCHMKFKAGLTRNKLVQILDVFVDYIFITAIEKNDFLTSYDSRFIDARTNLDKLLTKDKKKDKVIIKNFIASCEDNDILADLHQYLTGSKFDYLRVFSNTFSPAKIHAWLGSDEKGNTIETCKAWAMIEECITIKMLENVRHDCTNFSTSLAMECANEFKHDLPWFAMNHKKSAPQTTSTCFDAFARKDITALTNRVLSKLQLVNSWL